jgi:hypothetical protein
MSYLADLYITLSELNGLISFAQDVLSLCNDKEKYRIISEQYNVWMFKLNWIQGEIVQYTRF